MTEQKNNSLPPAEKNNSETASLAHEAAIVWTADAGRLPYVRETFVATKGRSEPIEWHDRGRVLGYAILDDRAARVDRCFLRRLFWVKVSDPYPVGLPCEAVDPASVHPGQPGRPAGPRPPVPPASPRPPAAPAPMRLSASPPCLATT